MEIVVDKEDPKKNKNLSDYIEGYQFLNSLVEISKDKYITVLMTLS
jgi:hypothetical protein